MATKVLLVDDEELVLKYMAELLESQGYRVSTASSGSEAIAALANAKFGLVIADVRMETPTSGFEVVRAAKAQPDPPIAVLLSAFPMSPADGRGCGADGRYLKGDGIDRLLSDLARLTRRRARSTSEASNPRKGSQAGH